MWKHGDGRAKPLDVLDRLDHVDEEADCSTPGDWERTSNLADRVHEAGLRYGVVQPKINDPEERRMIEVHRYPQRFWWGQIVIPIVSLLIFGFFGFLSFLISRTDAASSLSATWIWIALSYLLSLLFFGWYLSYRLAGVSISVGQTGVRYRNRDGELQVAFDRMTKISFPWHRRWVAIVYKDGTLRLGGLETLDDFLRELMLALDRRDLSDRYDRESLKDLLLRRTIRITFSDHTVQRLKSFKWPLLLLAVVNILLGVVLCVLAGFGFLEFLVISGIIVPYWFILIFGICEHIFWRCFEKQLDSESLAMPERDTDFERTIYRIILVLGEVLFVLALVSGAIVM